MGVLKTLGTKYLGGSSAWATVHYLPGVKFYSWFQKKFDVKVVALIVSVYFPFNL